MTPVLILVKPSFPLSQGALITQTSHKLALDLPFAQIQLSWETEATCGQFPGPLWVPLPAPAPTHTEQTTWSPDSPMCFPYIW